MPQENYLPPCTVLMLNSEKGIREVIRHLDVYIDEKISIFFYLLICTFCRSSRGWLYHKEHQIWFMKVPDKDLGKTQTDGRGPCRCFDPNTWAIVPKVWIVPVWSVCFIISLHLLRPFSQLSFDNAQGDFVYCKDDIEKKPTLPPSPSRR